MTDQARGWNALEALLAAKLPGVRALSFTPSPEIQSESPLGGVNGYRRADHWLLVTFGFSELFGKETHNHDISGFGFELTLRVLPIEGLDGQDVPPAWALNLLDSLAAYVFKTGNAFAPNHHIGLGGPLSGDPSDATELVAVAFTPDVELGVASTPNGRVLFLEVVGVTRDELQLARDWSVAGLMETLRKESPMLVTDLARKSVLSRPEVAAEIRARADKEGSAQQALFTSGRVEVERVGESLKMTLSKELAADVARFFHSRLRHGRPFDLVGREQIVRFTVNATGSKQASQARWRTEDERLVLELTPAAVDEFRAVLSAAASEFRSLSTLPGLSIRIDPN